MKNCQTAKLKPPPNKLRIRYNTLAIIITCMYGNHMVDKLTTYNVYFVEYDHHHYEASTGYHYCWQNAAIKILSWSSSTVEWWKSDNMKFLS